MHKGAVNSPSHPCHPRLPPQTPQNSTVRLARHLDGYRAQAKLAHYLRPAQAARSRVHAPRRLVVVSVQNRGVGTTVRLLISPSWCRICRELYYIYGRKLLHLRLLFEYAKGNHRKCSLLRRESFPNICNTIFTLHNFTHFLTPTAQQVSSPPSAERNSPFPEPWRLKDTHKHPEGAFQVRRRSAGMEWVPYI